MRKGWRTISANVAMALPVVLDVAWAVIQTDEFGSVIPHQYLHYYSMFIVGVNVYLRKITTTPMGRVE